MAFIEEEHTQKNFLSCGYLIDGGVVDTAKPWCWASLLAPLLVHHRRWSMR
jgi:hypothetical protein